MHIAKHILHPYIYIYFYVDIGNNNCTVQYCTEECQILTAPHLEKQKNNFKTRGKNA